MKTLSRLLVVLPILTSCAVVRDIAQTKVYGEGKFVPEHGEGPRYQGDYSVLVQNCAVPCYEPAPVPEKKEVRACGWEELWIRQRVLGPDRWGAAEEMTFLSSAGPRAVPCESIPAQKRDPAWDSIFEQARSAADLEPDQVVAIDKDSSWSFQTNKLDQVVARTTKLRVYGRNLRIRNPCAGGGDPLLFCEEGGSNSALALNAARHYVRVAKTLEQKEKANACRTAAWAAYTFTNQAIENAKRQKKDGKWTPGGHYLLRDGRKLPEAAMLKDLAKGRAIAAEQFKRCAGEGAPPEGWLLDWGFEQQTRATYASQR